MARKPSRSEAELLNTWKIALQNAQTQPEIATQIAKFGYDTIKLEEGVNLYNQTWQSWTSKQKEDDQTLEAYDAFITTKDQLIQLYKLHRRKAKVKFKRQNIVLNKLRIDEPTPRTYSKILVAIKKFYTELESVENDTIKSDFLIYNVTEDELLNAKNLINAWEISRSDYLKEKAESQDATKLKNNAIRTMAEWMYDFYSIAKVALTNRPQLLESIGVIVKS